MVAFARKLYYESISQQKGSEVIKSEAYFVVLGYFYAHAGGTNAS